MADCICDSMTEGILEECQDNAGGNRRIWITELCNVTVVNPSPATGYKEVTLTGATKYWKFDFKKGALNFTETKTGEIANGTEFYLQSGVLKLNRREKAKRATLLLMTKGKKLSVIKEDNNGLFWLLGEVDGMILNELVSQTGENKTDANGYTLTLTGEENEPASEISAAYIAILIAAGDIDEA